MSSKNVYTLNTLSRQATANIYPGNITLGSLNPTLTINGGQFAVDDRFVKKYEVIETTEDLLALSCTWYRIRKNDMNQGGVTHSISNMLSAELFRLVTTEDRTYANKIRDYYSKKIMFWTLKEQRLTQFRQDLSTYIHGDPTKFVEKTLPLVYRLPEFYEYDSSFDDIRTMFENTIHDHRRGNSKSSVPTTLTPVARFNRTQRKIHIKEYWLKDSANVAYRFILDPKNPLINLWEKEFSKSELNLTVNLVCDSKDDFNYYQIRGLLEI